MKCQALVQFSNFLLSSSTYIIAIPNLYLVTKDESMGYSRLKMDYTLSMDLRLRRNEETTLVCLSLSSMESEPGLESSAMVSQFQSTIFLDRKSFKPARDEEFNEE